LSLEGKKAERKRVAQIEITITTKEPGVNVLQKPKQAENTYLFFFFVFSFVPLGALLSLGGMSGSGNEESAFRWLGGRRLGAMVDRGASKL
jgi:hypothetical protein